MNINLKLAITKSEDMGVALNLRLTTPILINSINYWIKVISTMSY